MQIRRVLWKARSRAQAPALGRIDKLLASGCVPSYLLTRAVTPREYLSEQESVENRDRYTTVSSLARQVEIACEEPPATTVQPVPVPILPPLKVAVLLPAYFGSSKMEQDLTYGFCTTARAAGLEVRHWATDGAAYNEHVDQSPTTSEIVDSVVKFGPDLILGEGNYSGDEDGLGSSVYRSIASRVGAPIAIVLPDNWGGEFRRYWSSWSEVADVFLYFQGNSPLKTDLPEATTSLIPVPVVPVADGEKETPTVDVSFRGSLYGNRPHIFRSVAEFCVNNGLNFDYRRRKGSLSEMPIPASMVVPELTSARVVVNPTWRARSTHCVNGRSFQVAAAGVLLLQEEPVGGELLRDHFLPFRDYVPFSGTRELQIALTFAFRHLALGQTVACNGYEVIRRSQNPALLWHRILRSVNLA